MLKYIKDYTEAEKIREKEYDSMYKDIEYLKAKIAEREQQIERLKKRINKRRDDHYKKNYPDWIETIVKPLMRDLEKETELHGEIFGPFGLCCKTAIYLREDMEKTITEQDTIHITLEPPHKGKLYYETGEIKGGYPNGSIGELNGMNKVLEVLPDTIEEIVQIMHSSNKLRSK